MLMLFLKCCLKWAFWENVFEQCLQENGFSPVWVLRWIFRCSFCEKDFEHSSQIKRFSPEWILWCEVKWHFRENDLEHLLRGEIGLLPNLTSAWVLHALVWAVEELSIKELNSYHSKDEVEEQVDDENVEDVFEWVDDAVEDGLEFGHSLDGLQGTEHTQDTQGLHSSQVLTTGAPTGRRRYKHSKSYCDIQGVVEGVKGPHIFRTTKTRAFSTNTQSRFASVVFDCILGPLPMSSTLDSVLGSL